jgi:hypothetical protein
MLPIKASKGEQSMFVTHSIHLVNSEQPGKQSGFFVPTVYEKESPVSPWEYHVLGIDTREEALPDAEQLNALGKEGWIMTGVLDERASGKGSRVHYYFMRRPIQ